jgi:hypothetical protein
MFPEKLAKLPNGYGVWWFATVGLDVGRRTEFLLLLEI